MIGRVNRKHPVFHEHHHIQKYNHLKPNQKDDEAWAHLGIIFCSPGSRPLPGAQPREEQGQRGRMLLPPVPGSCNPSSAPPESSRHQEKTERRICEWQKGATGSGAEGTRVGSTPPSARTRDRGPGRQVSFLSICIFARGSRLSCTAWCMGEGSTPSDPGKQAQMGRILDSDWAGGWRERGVKRPLMM